MSLQFNLGNAVSQLDAHQWDKLTDGSPILSHAFLSTLELTHCVGAGTGWTAAPLIATLHGELVGAIPLYLKYHSYGEYVFDWAWAEAYERHGIHYYPKLLAAVPFTPITGARLLSADAEVRLGMVRMMTQLMGEHGMSSAHVLFPDQADAAVLQQEGWMQRTGVQFRWENEGYQDFDDFLGRMSHDKRKKIRQERNKIAKAGVICRQYRGDQVSAVQWDFFYACYTNTYNEHRSTPYLTREFFHTLAERMPQSLLLIIAELDGEPIAAAFNLYDQTTLYGRYWGASRYVPGLHFELCYYQAQQFCIENAIRYFEGGAQGEHKLARGFLPRSTCSYHQIVHPDFEAAIKDYVLREAVGMDHYHNELEERAPFKQAS